MPDFSIMLAWTVKVQPTTLAAHVAAYASLLTNINTLRLCHLHGKNNAGEDFITKMPKEIIDLIVNFMLDTERSQRLDECQTEYTCFSNMCRPIDHYTVEEQLDAMSHTGLAEPWDICEEPSDEQLAALDDKLDDDEYRYNGIPHCHNDKEPGVRPWQDTHVDGRLSWIARVGDGSTSSGMSFMKYNRFWKKHFGLKIWMTHDPHEQVQGVHDSTSAYLCLPRTSQKSRSWSPAIAYDQQQDHDWKFPETHIDGVGFSSAVSVPDPLSIADKGRFMRAINMLALKDAVMEGLDSADGAAVSDGDTARTGSNDRDAGLIEPKLRVLAQLAMEDDDP